MNASVTCLQVKYFVVYVYWSAIYILLDNWYYGDEIMQAENGKINNNYRLVKLDSEYECSYGHHNV